MAVPRSVLRLVVLTTLVFSPLLMGCVGTPAPPPAAFPPACPTLPATQPFAHPDIGEVSGMARSQRVPCMMWVHDDSGSEPIVYATDAQGRHLGTARIAAQAVDWEDMTSFTLNGTPYLMLADIGNNGALRASASLVYFPEPDLSADRNASVPASEVRTVTLRYPDRPFNSESLTVDHASDEILLVSKGGIPGESPRQEGLYTASFQAALREGQATLQLAARIATLLPEDRGFIDKFGPLDPHVATAIDLAPDGNRLAILTYRDARIWNANGTSGWAITLQAQPDRIVQVPPEGAGQMEALAFSRDGAWLLIGAEEGRPNSMLSVLPLG